MYRDQFCELLQGTAVTVDFYQIVSIISGVLTIVGLVKIVNTPLSKIRQNSEEIEKLKQDKQRRAEIDKAMLNGLTSITNHMIDGNGVDRLRASREELQRTLNEIATK